MCHCFPWKRHKYADDKVLYYATKGIDEIESILDSEMEKVGSYWNDNELLLNLKKGKIETMIFKMFGITWKRSQHNFFSKKWQKYLSEKSGIIGFKKKTKVTLT